MILERHLRQRARACRVGCPLIAEDCRIVLRVHVGAGSAVTGAIWWSAFSRSCFSCVLWIMNILFIGLLVFWEFSRGVVEFVHVHVVFVIR